MRDLKKEQKKLQDRYRLQLNRIKNDYHLYDKELALLMGWNVDQADYVRKLRNGEAEIFTCDMVTLSQNLIQQYGDCSLLQEMVPEGFIAFVADSNATNGRVDDEINNITLFSGKILEELKDSELNGRPLDVNKLHGLAEKIANESATIKSEVQG